MESLLLLEYRLLLELLLTVCRLNINLLSRHYLRLNKRHLRLSVLGLLVDSTEILSGHSAVTKSNLGMYAMSLNYFCLEDDFACLLAIEPDFNFFFVLSARTSMKMFSKNRKWYFCLSDDRSSQGVLISNFDVYVVSPHVLLDFHEFAVPFRLLSSVLFDR